MKFTDAKATRVESKIVEAERVSARAVMAAIGAVKPSQVIGFLGTEWLHNHLYTENEPGFLKMSVFVPDRGHVKVADGDWVVDFGNDSLGRKRLEVFTPEVFNARFKKAWLMEDYDHPDNAGTDAFVEARRSGPRARDYLERELKDWREWALKIDDGDKKLHSTYGCARLRNEIAGGLAAERMIALGAEVRISKWRVWAMTALRMDQSKTMDVEDVDDHLINELKRRAAIELMEDAPAVSKRARLFKRLKDGDLLLFADAKGWHACLSRNGLMPYRKALENRNLDDFLVHESCPAGWVEMNADAAQEQLDELVKQGKG